MACSENKSACCANAGIIAKPIIVYLCFIVVVVWALTGIVTKLRDLPSVEREHADDLLTFVYVLLGVSAALAIIRIGIAIYRHIRRPQTV